ncbi:methyltransferase domain-containing protein [Candidatus Dojkabacteria bacterium]|nr:methyltransferase domain-containing protein [Candidatus Dojkabacteria bacterium]
MYKSPKDLRKNIKLYESDAYISSYHRSPGERISRVLKYIKLYPSDIVVDYACGNGLLMDVIHNKVKKYIGVDFSKKFIQKANERRKKLKIGNARFYCMDIIQFSKLNERKFDKAFSMDFVEHLNDKDLKEIFAEIRRTIRSRGKLIIHTPNSDYFLEKFKKLGILKQTSGHIGVRNGKEYADILKSLGYKSINVHFLNHYLKFFKIFNVLSPLPFLGKYFKARLLIICSV